MAGHPNETEVWLREIENGGDLTQTDEKNALISMHDFWKTAPVGGELTSSFSMEDLLETNLDQTATLIRESHTTFLGPHVANNQYLQGYHTVLKSMGYRLRISEAVLSNKLKGTKLSMTWANDGTAPFYKDWPVWVYVTDENGDTIEKKQVEMKLSSILPGESVKTEICLETKKLVDLAGKKYNIRIGIEDPMTGKENLRLAMKCGYMDGRNLLW